MNTRSSNKYPTFRMNIGQAICYLFITGVLSYEHIKLEDPLDLIYEESWPYPPNQHENLANKLNEHQNHAYNSQALDLLEFLSLFSNDSSSNAVTTSSYKDTNFKHFSTSHNSISNQSNKTRENLDSTTARINTTKYELSVKTDTIKNKTIQTSPYKTEANTSKIIIFSSTKNSEKIKLYTALKKLNDTLDRSNGVNNLNQTSCLNCSDIKGLNECKTFEDNEMAELINLFCCQCSPSM